MKDKLNDYTWGIGLEHEMHIFHIPKKNTKEIVKDLILFDSESCIKRLLEDNNAGKIKLTQEEYDFLRNIPFELSGRVCNKKTVLERIPIQMPELITWQPFCSLKKKRNMINIIEDLSYARKKLFELIKKDDLSKKLIKTYDRANKTKVDNILLINSFNEWGEKMAFEPSEQYGYYNMNLLHSLLFT